MRFCDVTAIGRELAGLTRTSGDRQRAAEHHLHLAGHDPGRSRRLRRDSAPA